MPKVQPNLPFISHKNICCGDIDALVTRKVSESMPEGVEICEGGSMAHLDQFPRAYC